jgi:SAM-dependent methyltransferase
VLSSLAPLPKGNIDFTIPDGRILPNYSGLAMVDSWDVVAAYRLILGRDPENCDVVVAHAEQIETLADLRKKFFDSDEFYPPSRLVAQPLNWPPMNIELNASPEQLTAMRNHIEENWRLLGETEPHWSVLSQENFRTANIELTKDEFYASGRQFLHQLIVTVRRCGLSPGDALFDSKTCFELGCGVGRCTIFLSEIFENVIAADISPTHLEIARQNLERLNRKNVLLTHFSSFESLEFLPPIDTFISVIVLQHNPPPLIDALLSGILRKLNPGGIAYFQVPTYRLNYNFGIEDYMNAALPLGEIEMHVIPQYRVFEILHQNGCRLLECREDAWTGIQDMVSNSFLAIKE